MIDGFNLFADAAKRRHLPLWIREGLEKMEREKQRQMEKEQLELAMQNAKKAREEAENDNMEGKVEITGPIKSIFVCFGCVILYVV